MRHKGKVKILRKKINPSLFIGQILLINSVGEGGGCGFGHDLKRLESGDVGRVQNGSPLIFTVENRNGNNTICNWGYKTPCVKG